jgi:hypothetical protein
MRSRDFSLSQFLATLRPEARAALREVKANKKAPGGCPQRRVALMVMGRPLFLQESVK